MVVLNSNNEYLFETEARPDITYTNTTENKPPLDKTTLLTAHEFSTFTGKIYSMHKYLRIIYDKSKGGYVARPPIGLEKMREDEINYLKTYVDAFNSYCKQMESYFRDGVYTGGFVISDLISYYEYVKQNNLWKTPSFYDNPKYLNLYWYLTADRGYYSNRRNNYKYWGASYATQENSTYGYFYGSSMMANGACIYYNVLTGTVIYMQGANNTIREISSSRALINGFYNRLLPIFQKNDEVFKPADWFNKGTQAKFFLNIQNQSSP